MTAPQFASTGAREVFEALTSDAAPTVPPRVAHARKLLADAGPGPRRQQLFDNLIAAAPDVDETVAILRAVREIEATEAAAVPKTTPADLLATATQPEERGPYTDDAGRLRDPAGNVVDTGDDTWREYAWADAAEKLLSED